MLAIVDAKLVDDLSHQRIDRIFWRGDDLRPAQIRMLGTAPLEDSAGQVFPSDHFGLIDPDHPAFATVLATARTLAA